MQTMFEQGDATLKAWQHIVTKVEPFLRPFNILEEHTKREMHKTKKKMISNIHGKHAKYGCRGSEAVTCQQVKAYLKCMNVKYDKACWTTPRDGNIGKDPG
jgi:hypothetical protein